MQQKNNPDQHIIVLGGAFSTGKSTMLEQIRHDFGEKFRYIMDGGRAALETVAQGRQPEQLTMEELHAVQRLVMEHYAREEGKDDGRLVVSDGSLIEAAAYSQFVFSTRDMMELNALLRYRDWKQMYTYIKFPTTLPIEYDGVRHSDYVMQEVIDKRIDRVLAKNSFPVVRITSEDFAQRYAQVLKVLFTEDYMHHGR